MFSERGMFTNRKRLRNLTKHDPRPGQSTNCLLCIEAFLTDKERKLDRCIFSGLDKLVCYNQSFSTGEVYQQAAKT